MNTLSAEVERQANEQGDLRETDQSTAARSSQHRRRAATVHRPTTTARDSPGAASVGHVVVVFHALQQAALRGSAPRLCGLAIQPAHLFQH